MQLITMEDIDEIAMELKDRLCVSEDPQEREKFEISIVEYLEEALDP